jgi:hypothetical protein
VEYRGECVQLRRASAEICSHRYRMRLLADAMAEAGLMGMQPGTESAAQQPAPSRPRLSKDEQVERAMRARSPYPFFFDFICRTNASHGV